MLLIPTGTGPLWRTIMALVFIAGIAALEEESTTLTASTMAPAVDVQLMVSVTLTSTAGFACWGQALGSVPHQRVHRFQCDLQRSGCG